MRNATAAHLRKSQMLLQLAESKADIIQVRWGSKDLGSWKSASPQWKILGGKIRFQFIAQGNRKVFWISSLKLKNWGLSILLDNPKSPVAEEFAAAWHGDKPKSSGNCIELWDGIHSWLRCKFPTFQIIRSSKKSDLSRSLSGMFLRIFFRYRRREYLVIAAVEDSGDEIHQALSQALIWCSQLAAEKLLVSSPTVYLLAPARSSAVLHHRCQHLNRHRIQAEAWEYRRDESGRLAISRAPSPPAPEENKDFRWPVLGPFRWSSLLGRVLNLAPGFIRRYPRFLDYDSLRLWGLEFAQVAGPDRSRIRFGVGLPRIELTEDNFDSLHSLVEEILYYRRPDSPDTQHPYYKLQAERWLEALMLEDISRLFPEMAHESVYSQIPVYLGQDSGRIDILGVSRQGTLVVMELKVTEDYDLPAQALDYWGRVLQHNKNGDFQRRGYFSETRLNRERPKIYLISPVFSFHNSTESLLRFLDPDLELWKISINEDWRCGVKIIRRTCYRCGDMK